MSGDDALIATFPAILDALARANIGILVIAAGEGTYEKVYANEPALRHLGYSPEEWFAQPMWDRVAPAQREMAKQIFDRLAGGNPIPPVVEIGFVHREGHLVRAELIAGRVATPRGDALALLIRDKASQQQTQLSLLEADRIALVGALAAGFAHETNNPLTSVLLNLRTLRKQIMMNLSDAAQAAALRCLDDLTTGAERIASNVRALQTLATRGGQNEPIDLAAVVSAALRLAAPTLEPRAHVVRKIGAVGSVAGDESRVGQAVLAMLLFSCSGFDADAPGADNRIVVTVEQRAGSVVVEVSDNGRDLAPEEAVRAFDPFFRSPGRGAGVGVGLGVARSVATTLGGDVSLVPRTGGGAVITLRLPPLPAA